MPTLRTKVSQEQIDATLQAFKSLPDPVAKARLFSKLEAVKGMKSEIQALLKRGFLLEDVVQAMAGTGIDITTSALKTYMSKTVSKPGVKKSGSKSSTDKLTSSTSTARTTTAGQSEGSDSSPNRVTGSGRFEVKKDIV